jgi:exodeoxyribonuclease VII small subunit
MAAQNNKGRRDDLDSAAESDVSFEDALEKVQQSVDQLESGELSLSEALDIFSQGIRYLKLCYRRLGEAEQRIEKLLAVDDQGRPVTEPLANEEWTLEEKQEKRGRRRSQA